MRNLVINVHNIVLIYTHLDDKSWNRSESRVVNHSQKFRKFSISWRGIKNAINNKTCSVNSISSKTPWFKLLFRVLRIKAHAVDHVHCNILRECHTVHLIKQNHWRPQMLNRRQIQELSNSLRQTFCLQRSKIKIIIRISKKVKFI